MKKTLFLFFLLLIACLVTGEKLGVLTDVMRPQLLEVDTDKLYVLDGAQIYIYSAKDLKLINRFGKKGEGPGEMRPGRIISSSISIYPEYLLVAGVMGDTEGLVKIIYFTHEGKFIKEKKTWPQMFRVHPVGKNFVVNRLHIDENRRQTSVVAICDADLKEKKVLCRQEVSLNPKRFFLIADTIQFTVYNDKIYLENSKKGFIVEVFDHEGNLVTKIEKKVKPIKLTNSLKKSFIEEFKSDPLVKFNASHLGGMNAYLKNFNMLWPDFLPLIKDIIVSEDKIYLQTFNEKDNKIEFVIMDLKGNNQESVFLPKVMMPPFAGRLLGKGTRFFDIEKDKFYYIVENEDEEEWEVHVEKIK